MYVYKSKENLYPRPNEEAAKEKNYTGWSHWWVKDQEYKNGWVLSEGQTDDYYKKVEPIPAF